MAMELRIKASFDQIAADIKQLLNQDGSLTALNTTDKTSLVAAINEVLVAAGGGGDMLKSENLTGLTDYVAARTNLDVRSTAQVTAEIAAAIATVTLATLGGLDQAEVDARVQLIVGAAPAALDTLTELANALGGDANFSATITTLLGNKVDFSTVQTLTVGQQLQACQNIGVGSPVLDYLASYISIRDSP